LETARQLDTQYGQEYRCTLSFAELFAGNAKESQRLSQEVPGHSCGKHWLVRNGRHHELIHVTRQEIPGLFDADETLSPNQIFSAYPVLVSLNVLGRESEANAMAERMLSGLKPAVRIGLYGYGLTDVALLAQMGRREQALATLEQAIEVGWQGPYWQYLRDFDPALEPIRNEPRFRAAFSRLEASVAAQRARLPAPPPAAP
jgi:tetratricopeptide (TPR) repeat protein